VVSIELVKPPINSTHQINTKISFSTKYANKIILKLPFNFNMMSVDVGDCSINI
jgi:hypothetical protein